MPNTLLRSDLITRAAIRDLQNELTFCKTINRKWEPEFEQPVYRTGDTVNVRVPVQYIGGDGQSATVEDTVEKSLPITISHQPHVRFSFSSKDLTLTIGDFNERYLKQAMSTLANTIDKTIASYTTKFYYFYGTPGATISSFATANIIRAGMSQRGIPTDDRYLVLGYGTSPDFGSSMANFFNNRLNSEISLKGIMGNLVGFDVYEAKHVLTHTAGLGSTGGTPPTGYVFAGNVKTAVSSGNTITLKNLAPAPQTGTFKAGDVIYNVGSYIVNRKDHLKIPIAAQFTILADADTDGAGEATITVSPSIITDTSDPYQNVDVALAVDSEMYLAQTHDINLAYHPDALVTVSPTLEMPMDDGHDASVVHDPESGITLRVSKEYDQASDVNSMRIDCLLGVAVFPLLGMRVLS